MQHHQRDKSHRHNRLRPLVIAVSGIAVSAVALLWGWNTVAAGLFGLPLATFVHALSFQLVLLTLLFTVRTATQVNCGAARQPRR